MPVTRLADRGLEVVGIDGSEVAARQFGQDHHLHCNVLPIDGTNILLYKVSAMCCPLTAPTLFSIRSVQCAAH